jgi:hypothetical protein
VVGKTGITIPIPPSRRLRLPAIMRRRCLMVDFFFSIFILLQMRGINTPGQALDPGSFASYSTPRGGVFLLTVPALVRQCGHVVAPLPSLRWEIRIIPDLNSMFAFVMSMIFCYICNLEVLYGYSKMVKC